MTYEQDNHGEWIARAGCGHVCNPDEASDDGAFCVNCVPEPGPDKCPKCHVALVHYDGCLGYESLVCPQCHLDINDWKAPELTAHEQEVLVELQAAVRKTEAILADQRRTRDFNAAAQLQIDEERNQRGEGRA